MRVEKERGLGGLQLDSIKRLNEEGPSVTSVRAEIWPKLLGGWRKGALITCEWLLFRFQMQLRSTNEM